MNRLNMLAATGVLALAIGLTGCSSDSTSDSSSSSTNSAATQPSSASTSSSSTSSTAPAEPSQSTGSTGSAAGPGSISTCKVERKGGQVDATVVGMSCDDAAALWTKFPGKDSDMSQADVEYKGETFKCAILAQGSTVTGGCTVGPKAISIGGV